MISKIARLDTRRLIRLSGDEAAPWLQNLVTQTVTDLTGPVFAALLAPQGRLLADFLVWPVEGGLVLDVDQADQEMLITRLRLYRLRARVEIKPADGEIWAAFDGEAPERFTPDPRLAQLGARRVTAVGGEGLAASASEADYRRFRRLAGAAETAADGLADAVYAVEANLDLLNGVDFHKGCFVGQETTSRMKRRGQVKSRLIPLQGVGLAPGEVLNGERRAGAVLVAEGDVGLGLMRLDRLGGDLACNGLPVTALAPAWMAPVLAAFSPSTGHGLVDE